MVRSMADPFARSLVALLAALVGGALLTRLPARAPRDLVLTAYALLVALLGVFAIFGTEAAGVAAIVLVGVFALGAAVYALVGAVAHWAERE